MLPPPPLLPLLQKRRSKRRSSRSSRRHHCTQTQMVPPAGLWTAASVQALWSLKAASSSSHCLVSSRPCSSWAATPFHTRQHLHPCSIHLQHHMCRQQPLRQPRPHLWAPSACAANSSSNSSSSSKGGDAAAVKQVQWGVWLQQKRCGRLSPSLLK
jgi:hypothetical protein